MDTCSPVDCRFLFSDYLFSSHPTLGPSFMGWNKKGWFGEKDAVICRVTSRFSCEKWNLPVPGWCLLLVTGLAPATEPIYWALFLARMASLVAQAVKNPSAVWEAWVWSLVWEELLEERMATHSSILVWKIPWTEQSGGLQSMGLQTVRHD